MPAVTSPMRTLRQTAALAGGTFRQAVRMKAFVAPAAFAATAVAISPFLPSDGTGAGAVRVAITVCLVTASVFATFAAIMLASLIPARETVDKTEYMVATKPVPRWAIFAGRVLGLWLVVGAMLAGMAALSWAFIRYTAARESAARPEERIETSEALAVRGLVPPAWETGPVRLPRAGPKEPVRVYQDQTEAWRFDLPRMIVPEKEIEGRIEMSFGAGGQPDGIVLSARNPRTGEEGELAMTAPAPDAPGQSAASQAGARLCTFRLPVSLVAWDATDPSRPGEVDVTVTNRGTGALDLSGWPPVALLAGTRAGVPSDGSYRWEFSLPAGHEGPATFRMAVFRAHPQQEVRVEFQGLPGAAPYVESFFIGPSETATVHVPAEYVPPDGRLSARLVNPSRSPVVVPIGAGMAFAPRAGWFTGSLVRWLVIEFAKLAFLVLVTCAGATVLSFPIPAVLGGAAAAGGYLVSFVAMLASSAGGGLATLTSVVRVILPDLAGATATDLVVEGTLVPAGAVLGAVVWLVVIRGGVVAALGAYLAHRREVGV